MTRVAIGLGSNVGERLDHLRRGVAGLGQVVAIERCSSVWESEPMYYAPQPPFLNACCTGSTDLPPDDLLAALQDVERKEGRRASGPRFGPRELDLDLLLYGASVIDRSDLHVPHPAMRERAFVLVPLAEVAGDWIVPGSGRTVDQLTGDVSRSGIRRHSPPPQLSPATLPGT